MRVKSKNNFLIRQKYIYSLLIIIVIFLSAFISYLLLINYLDNEIKKTNTLLLNNSQINLDSQISSLYSSFIDLTMKTSVKDFMYNSQMSEYVRYKNNINIQNDLISIALVNNLESVYLYSTRSNTIITNTTYSEGNQFYDMAWKTFLSVTSNKDSIYTVRKLNAISSSSDSTDILTIVYTYPMPDSYNESAVIFNIDEGSLFDSISSEQKDSEQLFIMDANGKILLHSNKAKLYSYANTMDCFSKIKSNDSGCISTTIDGVQSTLFFVTSPITGWKFVRITSISPLKTIVYTVMPILFPLIILILALSLFSMKLVNPWIYKPIYDFIDRTSQKIRESLTSNQTTVSFEALPDFDNLEKYFYEMIETNQKNNEQIQKNIPVMKWKLITDIILGNQTKYNELSEAFKLLDIDLHSKNYLAMLVDIDKKNNILADEPEKSKELCMSMLASQTEIFIKKITKGVTVLQQDKSLTVILSFETPEDYQTLTISIIELMKNFMQTCFDATITVAIGDIYENFSDVQKSFVSAANALKYKVIMGENSVIWADDIKIPDTDQIYKIISKIEELDCNTNLNDFSLYKETLDEFFDMISKQMLPFDSVLQIVTILLAKIVTLATDLGIDANLLSEKFGSIYAKLYTMDTIEQIKSYSVDVFETINNIISNKKNIRRDDNLIEKIIQYLNENYMDPDISLSFVADTFFINKQYLGKIFKTSINIGFSEYLINLRIKHAKRLLGDTSIKINKIASLVGYTNIHSFIKIFKNQTGMTPSQYRNIKS